MKKLVKVLMLPTENDEKLRFSIYKHSDNGNIAMGFLNARSTKDIPQHLYFTSDEEIKEDDYCVALDTDIVFKVSKKDLNGIDKFRPIYRKIVATTDKSLHNFYIHTGSGKYWEDEPTLMKENLSKPIIPKIPQQFIEDYCKAGGINEVYIETEDFCKRADPFKYCYECKGFQSPSCGYGKDLLLDSNNCVIISPVDPKLYTKEEVMEIIWKYATTELFDEVVTLQDKNHFNNWIKENLK